MESIHIGVIGAGGIAHKRHLPNLKQIDDVELISVANNIKSHKKAIPNFEEGMKYMRFTEAVRNSLHTKQLIQIKS
jgi:predicted dehydrogenase